MKSAALRWLSRSALARFTLLFTSIFAIGSGIAFYLAYSTVSAYTAARIRDTMATDIVGLRDVFASSGITGLTSAVRERSAGKSNPRVYLLVSPDGEKIAGNFDAWPNNLPPQQSDVSFADPEEKHHFDGSVTLLAGDYHLLVAHDRAEHEALLAGLRRELVIPALLALAAAIAAGYFVSRRLLARIEALNATCKQVESGDLAARATGADQPDEFGQLAANVNAMLARIGMLVHAVHDLSNHIAHEMRTPLARLRSKLERARRHLAAEPAQRDAAEIAGHAFDTAIDETQKIIDMFSALLDIAAAEAAAGDRSGLKPVNLKQTLDETIDIYEIVAEDRQISLHVSAEPVSILGEPVLLLRMLANVVDNALKFTPQGGAVSIHLRPNGQDFRLEISDTGKGMPEDFLQNAFERFARAQNTSTTPGHGLGLPLVRAIALRHGLKITLENAAPGLRVVFSGQRYHP